MERQGNAHAKAPRLLDEVRDTLRRRHDSSRTEQSYVDWIKRFIVFSGRRHPRDMGAPEVTAFLSHLARDRNVAAATQNQALAALLFLYKEILGQALPWLDQIDRACSASLAVPGNGIQRRDRRERRGFGAQNPWTEVHPRIAGRRECVRLGIGKPGFRARSDHQSLAELARRVAQARLRLGLQQPSRRRVARCVAQLCN